MQGSKSEKVYKKVVVIKNATPVKFKDKYLGEFIERLPNVRELNEKGWHFYLNLVSSKDMGGICAASLCIFDAGGTIQPMLSANLFKTSQKQDLAAFIAAPQTMFEKYESNVLQFEGDYSEEEIEEMVVEWSAQQIK